jgi:hypothetical protein
MALGGRFLPEEIVFSGSAFSYMEKLAVPKMLLREYMRWYIKNFLPSRRYQIFLRFESGKMCIYFSYDVAEEVGRCLRRCRGKRDYDDCLTECYEDVFDSVEEFLCEQVDELKRLLRRRGVEVVPDCGGGYGGEGEVRWVRLCVLR